MMRILVYIYFLNKVINITEISTHKCEILGSNLGGDVKPSSIGSYKLQTLHILYLPLKIKLFILS